MLQQIKKSLKMNGITLLTKLDLLKKYLAESQNEMTIMDAIKCFHEFDNMIKNINLTGVGKKLIEVIIEDDLNPFQYDRAISDLIRKIEYEYSCNIRQVPLIELMFLVRFAHMYLGESQATGICPNNEVVKWINFGKKELFVYRYEQDELYYDGHLFEGRFNGDSYNQALELIKSGWAIEARFLDKGQQVTCYKNYRINSNVKLNEDIMTITKNDFDNGNQSIPINYFAFRSFPELDFLNSITEMTTLTEIMDYMLSLPINLRIDKKIIDINCFNGEELPF